MENNNYKILVVDDNANNIKVLANLLSENGYDVDYAMNGSEAIQLVASEDFDLILLDIMMPGMDGFEVCKRIKKDKKKREIPIIFLTAKTDTESIEKAFNYGGLDYVNKPFKSSELLARVKTHVELKVSQDQLKEVNIWLEDKVKERTTELKIANDKLLEMDNTKSEFLKIISHEIRTPLNGIIGGLSLIKDSDLDEESMSYIAMLDHSASRLEDFSYKALDISQFNSYGSEILHTERLSIIKLISEVITELDAKQKEKELNISLNTKLDNEKFTADPNYLYKSILFIIDNAIKFSPNLGKINISVSVKENRLIIEVKDEGVGFKDGFIISEIGPFENKEHVDSDPGLSLYLANQIVTAHGGTIENGNNKEKGAFVKILLPL